MKTVFHYMDYRHYLRERYEELKRTVPAFSYRYFSRRAGFASPNFLKLVIEGKRNLSTESALAFARVLKLNRREQRYFAALVQFNQAAAADERQHFYEQLIEFSESQRARHLEREQYTYLSRWYYPAIVELVTLPTFRDDPSWIAAVLQHRISIKEAKEACDLLQRIGMLARDAAGRLQPVHSALTTGEEARSLAAFSFHEQVLDHAKTAVRRQPTAEREFAAMTMALSPEQHRAVREMIRDLRKRLLTYLARPSGTPAAVYQFSAQLFALSVSPPHDGGEKGRVV